MKNLSKIAIAVLVLAAVMIPVVRANPALVAIISGSGEEKVVHQPLPANTVRVEGDPWSGYAYFRDPKFMDGMGVDYKYEQELDQAARARKLSDGQTNFIVTTMDQLLSKKPAGRVVAIIDESNGADALALNSKLHTYLTAVEAIPRLVAQLAAEGRKPVLAYTGDSPSEFLMRKLANTRDELRLTDFQLVSVDQSSTALKMMQENKADLAVIWEPDTAAAIAGGYKVVLSSRDVPRSIVDVLVASDYVIEHQPALVQKVVDALYRARRKAVLDPKAFAAFIAADAGLEAALAERMLAGIKLYDAAAGDEFLNTPVQPLDETRAFEALETIAGLLNLSDATIVPDRKLLDGRFVAETHKRLQ